MHRATPLGTLALWSTRRGLRRLGFHSGPDLARSGEALSADAPPAHVQGTLDAIEAYFEGASAPFDAVPLDLNHVTPFRQRVYDCLRRIPRGHVMTYGDVAREIGEGPGAARAVGQAVGANPVALIIPCHRVVASNGSLSGYMGGVRRKASLLRLEGVEVEGDRSSSKVHPEVLRLPL